MKRIFYPNFILLLFLIILICVCWVHDHNKLEKEYQKVNLDNQELNDYADEIEQTVAMQEKLIFKNELTIKTLNHTIILLENELDVRKILTELKNMQIKNLETAR